MVSLASDTLQIASSLVLAWSAAKFMSLPKLLASEVRAKLSN
jgi:hypothetical protein